MCVWFSNDYQPAGLVAGVPLLELSTELKRLWLPVRRWQAEAQLNVVGFSAGPTGAWELSCPHASKIWLHSWNQSWKMHELICVFPNIWKILEVVSSSCWSTYVQFDREAMLNCIPLSHLFLRRGKASGRRVSGHPAFVSCYLLFDC